jgi:hypothetical protein
MRLPCAVKAQDAKCVDMRFDTHGAAGAVKRPAFRTSPLGETERLTGAPWSRTKPRGDDMRPSLIPHAAEPCAAGRLEGRGPGVRRESPALSFETRFYEALLGMREKHWKARIAPEVARAAPGVARKSEARGLFDN